MSQLTATARALLCGGAMLIALSGCGRPTAGDPKAGERLFLQCRACHVVAAGEPHTVGPNLAGVFGARAGARPGYDYSSALARSGLTWNAATLDRFLTQPGAAVPGTRMAFAGVPDAKARANLIAYLETLRK